MGTAAIVIRIIEALAWPVVVAIIFFIFRREVGAVISRLSRVRYGDLTFEFGKDLQEVEESAVQSGIRRAETPQFVRTLDDGLLRMIDVAPRASIIEAWINFEATIAVAAEALDITARPALLGRNVIRTLVKREMLPEKSLEIYEKLRRMRNNAAHAWQFEVDRDEALRYIHLVSELTETIRNSISQTRGADN